MAAVRSRDARGARRATRRARRRPRARDARMADDRGHPRDVRLGARRCAAAGVAPGRPDAARQHLGHARVGERRSRRERAAELGSGVRDVRARGRGAVPLGASLDRLERAEPASLAVTAVANRLRHAAPEPRGDGDQGCHPARVDRRRRDRAARWPRWHVTGRLHPRHGAGRRAARCVRAPSAPALAGGDAYVRRVHALRNDLTGDARPPGPGDP